jgi:hypothetical protein
VLELGRKFPGIEIDVAHSLDDRMYSLSIIGEQTRLQGRATREYHDGGDYVINDIEGCGLECATDQEKILQHKIAYRTEDV